MEDNSPARPLPPSSDRRIPWTGLPAAALVTLLAALLAWHSLTDLDIWFHLRAGRDLLSGHGFPHVNTYSFTDTSYTWLNHEWLFQAVLARIAPEGTGFSTTVDRLNQCRMVLVLLLTLVLLLDRRTSQRWRTPSGGSALARSAAVVAMGLGLMWPRLVLRPELVSLILLTLLVRRAEAYHRRSNPPTPPRDPILWQIFGLVVLWAQCHGFVAAAPVVLLVAAGFARQGRPGRWLPVPVSIAALTLTPNLWQGLVYPIRALAHLHGAEADLGHTVAELVPLLATPNALHLTIGAFQLSLIWGAIFALLGARHISPLRLVIFVLAAAAALANERNIALYGVGLILLHGELSGCWPHPWWRRVLRWPDVPSLLPWQSAALITLPVLGLCALWVPALTANDFYLHEGVGRRFGTGSTPALYPRRAATALSREKSPRTFANLDAAAYLLGNSPAQVFIDGRTEAYPAQRWAEYNRLKKGGDTALQFLHGNRTEAVVLSLRSGAFRNLAMSLHQSPRWAAMAAGAGGILFQPKQRSDRTGSDSLLTTTATRLLESAPDDPTRAADLHLAAADLFDLTQQPGRGRLALSSGLALRPDHPSLNHNLGNILMADGEFEKAIFRFQQALQTNPRLAGSALNIGVCQMRLGQLDAAIAAFQRAIRIDSGRYQAWANLAFALRRNGEPAAARRALENAVELRPDDTRLQKQLRIWP